MSKTITRRAALTGTAAGAAALVAGTGPALAVEHDRADDKLRRLWAVYLAQEPITRAGSLTTATTALPSLGPLEQMLAHGVSQLIVSRLPVGSA